MSAGLSGIAGPAASLDAAGPVRRSPRKSPNLFRRIIRHRADYLYILPAFGVMLLVIGYPVYDTIYLSFFTTPPSLSMADKVFVGARQLHAASWPAEASATSPGTPSIWTFFSTLFAFVLGFGAALALNREFVGRGLIRGILLIPYVISAVAAAYVWRWLYHSDFGVIGALSVALGFTEQADQLPRRHQPVLPSLIVVNVWKEFSLRHDHDAGRAADRAGRSCIAPRRWTAPGTWQRFWHITVPHLKGVTLDHRAAADRHQPQPLHHPLDHDRRRPGRRLADLDHRHLPDRLRPHPLRPRLGLLGDPVHRDDGARLFLRPRADRRGDAGGRNERRATESPPGAIRAEARRRIGGWRVAGWVFLALLLVFAVLPMVWMLLTSLKTQFAALQYPPEWMAAATRRWSSTRGCCRPPATSARNSCATCGTASGFRPPRPCSASSSPCPPPTPSRASASPAASCCSTRCCCATCFPPWCS